MEALDILITSVSLIGLTLAVTIYYIGKEIINELRYRNLMYFDKNLKDDKENKL